MPTRDFHDWACRSYLNTYQHSVLDELHTVAARGAGQMAISLTVGLIGLVACLAAVQFSLSPVCRSATSWSNSGIAGPARSLRWRCICRSS